uniref:Interferon-induced protein 44-like n=1 Tax=Mola mola TaxID=94237 RepID=A0A3Q3XFM5_MOLML
MCQLLPLIALSLLQYISYKIGRGNEGYYSFIFTDIMGFDQNASQGIHIEDVKLALRGHVAEGYKFVPNSPMTQDSGSYQASPSLDDRVHVLVSVIPAGRVNLLSDSVVKKMREVRLEACEMGIPQVAILTKVDEACPTVNNNIENIYKSKYLKQQVDTLSVILGLPSNCIYLVKNYETENSPNDDINAPILSALRQIISYGEDFVNDL